MSDTTYEVFQHYGTNAQRLAFTPNPAAGIKPIYIWYETDTNNVYVYTTGWHIIAGSGAGAITSLTGDVTATGPGAAAATIANDAVTYAKIQNISAISKLLGRGSAAGAGDTQEITLGTNLAMSGTTLNATGGGASVLSQFILAAPDGALVNALALSQVILRGTRAGQPGAATLPQGALYYVTDEGVLEFTSGAVWLSYSSAVTPTTGLVKARKILTNAQILTANSVPITLVAAVANKVIVPIHAFILADATAGGYSTGQTYRVRIAGDAQDLLVPVANLTFAGASNRSGVMGSVGSAVSFSPSSDAINKNLELSAANDVTGGNAANYIAVEVAYWLFDSTSTP